MQIRGACPQHLGFGTTNVVYALGNTCSLGTRTFKAGRKP